MIPNGMGAISLGRLGAWSPADHAHLSYGQLDVEVASNVPDHGLVVGTQHM
jgi:hypothetical protein